MFNSGGCQVHFACGLNVLKYPFICVCIPCGLGRPATHYLAFIPHFLCSQAVYHTDLALGNRAKYLGGCREVKGYRRGVRRWFP